MMSVQNSQTANDVGLKQSNLKYIMLVLLCNYIMFDLSIRVGGRVQNL